jgi:hypothetical protein
MIAYYQTNGKNKNGAVSFQALVEGGILIARRGNVGNTAIPTTLKPA